MGPWGNPIAGRTIRLLQAAILLVAVIPVRGQLVDTSDINIGIRSDNSVRDVQADANNEAPAVEAESAALEQDEALKNEINAALTSPKANKIPYSTLTLQGLSTNNLPGALAQISAQIAVQTASIEKLLKEIPKGKQQKDVIYQSLTRYTFTNNDSLIGKGVLASNQLDAGIDIQIPEGTEIIPYFSYAHAADKAAGTKTGTNLLGGTISFNQKVYPFIDEYPKAYQPFPDKFTDFSTIYPGYDVKAGADFSFGSTDKYTYKKGAGSGYNQDQWTVTPNVTFDLYVNPRVSVAIIPSYAYGLTSTDTGVSGSNGVFQLQDRNSCLLTSQLDSKNQIKYSVLVYELNSLERDVNLDPQPPATADGYQTWAKFGAGINVVFDSRFTFVAQYTYEAFNVSYEAHYVTASLNYRF